MEQQETLSMVPGYGWRWWTEAKVTLQLIRHSNENSPRVTTTNLGHLLCRGPV